MSRVEAVVRDALDKVTDALTEGQTDAVVRRVTEGLSATVRPSERPLDALANALHSIARHHGNDDESPLTSAEVTRLRQAAHVLFTLSEAGWQD